MDPNNEAALARRQLMSSVGAASVVVSTIAISTAQGQGAPAPSGSPMPTSTPRAGGARMPEIKGVHHVGVRAFDKEASKQFWCGTLGFVPHPEKDNWLGMEGSDHKFIHLMPADNVSTPSAGADEDARDLAKHVALEVTDLRVVAARLLEAGCKPFQADIDPSKRREIASADELLDFGIGTVFVLDPSGNIVEFIQRDYGIFAKIKG